MSSLLFAQGLYDEKFTSMDEMGGFEPTDTSGFISMFPAPLLSPPSPLTLFPFVFRH